MNKIVPQERRDRKERVREEEEERKLKNKVKERAYSSADYYVR